MNLVRKLSRRDLLKGLGATASTALLAACTTPTATDQAAGPGASAETPEVWVFQGQPTCPGGGNDEKTQALRDLIQEETGVLVSVYMVAPGTAQTEKLNLLLASGSEPLDLFEGNWPDFKTAIIPVDDLLAEYGENIVRMNSDYAWARMRDAEGKTWGYPRLGLMAHTHFCFFRTDWLAEAGLEMPTMWDQMEETIVAFRDLHPESVVAADGRNNLMMNTLGAFVPDGNSNWLDGDGMLKPVELHPGYREWVAKMNEWWQLGYFQQETFANPDFRAMLNTLTIGTWLGWYSRITIWWEQIRLDAGYTDIDYGFPETMTGPEGLAKTNNVGGNSAYMIPRKSKSPEAVIRYIDWCYRGLPDDATNLVTVRAGLEGVDWEWVDKAAGQYRMLVPATAACEEKYASDFYNVKGMGTEPYVVEVLENGQPGRQSTHTVTYYDKFDLGKMPIDFDVPYDTTLISSNFPGLADFQRLLDEESIKFITGVRPLSEWSDFMAQVERAGLDDWSRLYTEQYRLYHPA